MPETKVDENGNKYIVLEPTPQACADIFYLAIMNGDSQEVRDNSLVELLRYVKNGADVKIGPRRLSI